MANSIVAIQNALNAGELSPSLYGRQDLEKYHSGTSTCRNFFSNYRGGISSRAGLAYVGTCKQQYPIPPRDIPFQFSLNQGYVLEFGNSYMRIKSNGAYVIEAAVTVSSASGSTITTSSPHGYSVGDWIYDSGNTGFSGLTWIITGTTSTTITVTDTLGKTPSNPSSTGGTVSRIYTVASPYAAVDLPYLKYTQSADVMTLTCVNQNTGTEYPPYDLVRHSNTNWTFTQESFGSSITAPSNVTVTATSSTTLSTWYSYVVTAVDAITGEESVASLQASVQNNDISLNAGSNTISWTAVSNANYYNVYAATPSYQATVPVSSLFGFIGRALGPSYTDTNITPDFAIVPPVHNNPFERGVILDVNPTAGGTNYSQSTIGYTISTSTGSGFVGTPVASNGQFVGFVINNPGKNYQSSDTIAITDSGGGVATGNYVFASNPANTGFITVNGQVITFKTSPVNSADVHIENTLALTLQTLANFLNSQSANLSLSCAVYTTDATHLYITYKTPGTVGNAFTITSDGGSSHATASGATLTGGGTAGSGATATLSVGPESGTYPSVCAYFQQRRVFGGSLNQPDTYWMSQPGLFSNFDNSVPVTDSDSITGTPWAQQVNGLQFLVPMPGGLVALTGKGAWQVNGGSQAAITPSSQTAVPQAYNGCSNLVPPIQNNYDILYLQAKGSIFRDLSYNFFVNIYTGTDLTVLSNHLFQDYQMEQWCWAEEPYKLIWVIRSDGTMLCLTYLKEQDIYSWTRHDTNGLFVGVCSITEPPVDAVYVITQRYVDGAWRYYSERMDNRLWSDVEDAFCVDAGLTTPKIYYNATAQASASFGDITVTLDNPRFTGNETGWTIQIGGGIGIITEVFTNFVAFVTLSQPITQIIPNDPNKTPLPQSPNNWSLSEPITTISGLNHLEGMTVTGLADGSVISPQVVTNGSITLPVAASLITVGLPYTCQAQTMYFEHPDEGGSTVQNRRKNISALGLRVESSRGLQIGADQPDQSAQQNNAPVTWSNMVEIKERTMFVNAGSAVPLFTGDYYQAITSGWKVTGQCAIQQVYPLPANLLSVIAYIQVGDDK